MHWHRRATAVRVAKDVMAAGDPCDLETGFRQGLNEAITA